MRSFAPTLRSAAVPVLFLAAVAVLFRFSTDPPQEPKGTGAGPTPSGLPLGVSRVSEKPAAWETLTKPRPDGRPRAVPARLAAFPDVASWREGDRVRLPLDTGEVVEGRVNLVTDADHTRRVAGELTGGSAGKGSFSFGQRAGGLEGSLLFESVDRAVLYSGDGSLTEAIAAKASDLLCMGYPKLPPGPRPPRESAAPDNGPSAAPPALSSRPTAAAVLFLDFDGAVVTDPDWNRGLTISAGNSGLTDTEIALVWRRVREDLIPFDVDVTTIESRYNNAAVGKRMRCIITQTDGWYNDNNPNPAGGVAYLNSFDRAGGPSFSSTIPCWVFSEPGETKFVAEATSHELGHTLGLSHDGTASREYYEGHGTGATGWAPIMGVGYSRNVVQWSKGEYPGANNQEDDLAMIAGTANGFGYIDDEAGATLQTSAVLPVTETAVNFSGLITGGGDNDVYQFQSSGGNVNLTIRPYSESPNLDIVATLENSAGTVLATSNPAGTAEAVLGTRLTTSGTYYLRVAGSGFGSAATGYTGYGSVGDYTITGTVPTAPPEIAVEVAPAGGIENGAGASFGDVVSGGRRSLTFTIRNTGVGNLIELALSKSGAHASDFTVSALPAQSVDPGGTTQFTVTFAPVETGAKSALLRIASNDKDENPFEIPLTANGTPAAPPDIIVSNASGLSLADGGAVVVGNTLAGTAIRRTFTLRNDGLAPLTGLAVSKDGANAADFTVTPPGRTTLNFGQSTTFEVSFNPPVLGTRTASLHVLSNDPDEASFDMPLTGAGVSAGATDSFFDARLTGKIYATAEQPDGRVIVAGDFNSIGGGQRTNIARLNPDGSLDDTFQCATNDFVYCVAVQPDGKILVGGQFYEVNGIPRNRLARVNTDGSLDAAFNPDAGGFVYSLAVLPDGKIMAGGAFYQIGGQGRANIARLNANGTADPSFTGGVNDYVYCLAVQDDGKVVIGGGFTMHGATTRNYVARVTAAGALDTAFNPNANGSVLSVALQPDGKPIIGGSFTALGSVTRNHIARLTAAGAPDTAFKPDISDNVYSIALQADGKILAGGWFLKVGAASCQRIARLNAADGALDTGFNASADAHVFSLAVLQDGGVMAGGFFQNTGGLSRPGLGKLLNGPPTTALTVPSSTTVQWLRGGTAPEVTSVSFETSPDGEVWTKLGNAARMTGGWRLTGQTLNGLGRMRARASTSGGLASGSGGLIGEIVNYGTAPEITVEQPAGNSLADHVSTVDFGLSEGAAPLTRRFTVWNYGTAPLTGLSRSVTGAQAAEFTASALPAATIQPGENLVFDVTFQPGGAGVREAELRITSNDADENPFRVRLAGAAATPYLAWKLREFGTASNSGLSSDSADGDGDGMDNLMEFSLGLPPEERTDTPVAVSLDGAFLRFTYPRAVEALSDVTFSVEWSDQPDTAPWSAEGVAESVTGESAGVQNVLASVPVGGAGRRFVRLRVTQK